VFKVASKDYVKNGKLTYEGRKILISEIEKRLNTKVTFENRRLPIDYHILMEEVVSEMEIGFGKIGMPLRVALLGKMGGPNIDVIMAVIGKEETMLRIAKAITANS
ncbi:MAG: hypothetical protein Q9M37_09560, partial [Desulfonauticus sp.]|nr:hypothetical protein [Desulfonauticus sp.]